MNINKNTVVGSLAIAGLVFASFSFGSAATAKPNRAPEKLSQVATLVADIDAESAVYVDDDMSEDTPDVLVAGDVTGEVLFTITDESQGIINMVNFTLPMGATWSEDMLLGEEGFDNIEITCGGSPYADISSDGRTLTIQGLACDIDDVDPFAADYVKLNPVLGSSDIEWVDGGDNTFDITSAYRTEKSRSKGLTSLKSWVITHLDSFTVSAPETE